MSTDILLLNPQDTTAASNSLDLSVPPLHLLYLAGALEKAQIDVAIFDDDVYKVGFQNIANVVNKIDPKILAITATTATIVSCLEYLKNIKKHLPNVLCVIGGPHTTFLPIDTLKDSPDVDVVVIGEGEETLVELSEYYLKYSNTNFEGIRGIAYRNNDQIKLNELRPLIENLDDIPLPARHLIPFEVYDTSSQGGGIITSRGCPFSCNYCSSSLIMGRKYRYRSPENVVEELEELVYKYGLKDVAFLDDIFMLKPKRAIAISDEIKNRGLDLTFVASTRVNKVDRDTLTHLKNRGMSTVYMGVESGSQRILDLMNKKIKIRDAEKAFKLTKEVGLDTMGSFILGYPGETPKEMDNTINFAIKLDPDWAQFSILTPFPGTPIYNELNEKNLIEDKDWDNYTVLNSVVKYEEFGLSKKLVERKLVKAYLKFYSRPRYLFEHKGRLSLVLSTINNAFIKPLYYNETPRSWYKDFKINESNAEKNFV